MRYCLCETASMLAMHAFALAMILPPISCINTTSDRVTNASIVHTNLPSTYSQPYSLTTSIGREVENNTDMWTHLAMRGGRMREDLVTMGGMTIIDISCQKWWGKQQTTQKRVQERYEFSSGTDGSMFLMAHREFSLGCQLILLQTTNVINRHVESMQDYVRSSYWKCTFMPLHVTMSCVNVLPQT